MFNLRVIAGSAKKMQLKSPKGSGTRPTADRVKESIFNILAPRLPDSHFLDLFAGAGGIAIEALSRGAERAVLVEKDARVADVLRENLRITKLNDRAEVLVADVIQACLQMGNIKRKFDIIYLDPPYYSNYYSKVLNTISQCQLLNANGILLAESSKKDPPEEQVGDLVLIRRQTYGDTIINFYHSNSGGI